MNRLFGIPCLALAAFAADPRQALTFHAPFDGSTDATTGKGDRRLYTAASYKVQRDAVPGLPPDVELAKGQGRKGDALLFKKKNTRALFFKAKDNLHFDPRNWTGSIVFWLSLDPETDLEPGFCDPIQVTDKAYNDSAIWVDFTKDDKPRHFRLGVFGSLKKWNPENLDANKFPAFLNRLAVVKKYPFAKGKWTQVAITFSGLGSGKGEAKLYLNGKHQADAGAITEPFEWDLTLGAIRLGVGYVGLFDDLAIYNRVLTPAEIEALAR